MIPKKIHLIWVGGVRPTKFDYLVSEIKRINDDYEVIEWNDDNIDFQLINQDLFEKTENPGAKSDILRFELLYKYGGIYMDYDFLQVKKFDDILNCDFFAGACNETEVWNSIVGSVAGNEICEKFLDGLKDTKPIKMKELGRTMDETGPFYLTRLVNNNKWTCNYKHFAGDYFFGFPAAQRFTVRDLSEKSLNHIKSFITDNTYCLHIHTTTWQ